MQSAASPQDGVTFEVERLEVCDGCLLISGHWSGVRGMRFMRPTLVAGGRRMLATLEHKPWAPSAERPWTAAFPWEDADLDIEDMSLAVAPSVTVMLDSRSIGTEEIVVADRPPARPSSEPLSSGPLLRPRDDLAKRAALQRRLEEAQARNAELDARCLELARALRLEQRKDQDPQEAREDPQEAREDPQEVRDDQEARGPQEARDDQDPREHPQEARDDLVRARTAAEHDRDRVLAQLEEAVEEREAALRTRSRMEIQRDEAVQAREAAGAELAQAIAARAEATAQRDEALLANRTLERQMRKPAGADGRHAAGANADGVLELWLMRGLGTVAALSFITLLVMLLRVLI